MSPRAAEKRVERAALRSQAVRMSLLRNSLILQAGFLGGDAIVVFLGVEIAEINVVGGWRHLAAATVGEDKHARAGAVLVNGHGGSPEIEF